MGDLDGAIALMKKTNAMPRVCLPEMDSAYRRDGSRGFFSQWIACIIADSRANASEPAVFIAELYSRLGDRDRAFTWLERGHQHRSGVGSASRRPAMGRPAAAHRSVERPAAKVSIVPPVIPVPARGAGLVAPHDARWRDVRSARCSTHRDSKRGTERGRVERFVEYFAASREKENDAPFCLTRGERREKFRIGRR